MWCIFDIAFSLKNWNWNSNTSSSPHRHEVHIHFWSKINLKCGAIPNISKYFWLQKAFWTSKEYGKRIFLKWSFRTNIYFSTMWCFITAPNKWVSDFSCSKTQAPIKFQIRTKLLSRSILKFWQSEIVSISVGFPGSCKSKIHTQWLSVVQIAPCTNCSPTGQ